MPAWALTGSPGLSAAGAEALYGPADLGAVHGGEKAAGGGGEGAGGGGLVVRGGVAAAKMEMSPPWVSMILSQALKAAPERRISSERLAPCFGCGGVAGEVEHPAGEDVGELDEVGGHGVAVLLAGCRRTPRPRPSCRRSGRGARPWW